MNNKDLLRVVLDQDISLLGELNNSPKVILAHIYPPAETPNGQLLLGDWQKWCLRALLEFVKANSSNYEDDPAHVLIPGGYTGLKSREILSLFYAEEYRKAFEKEGILDLVKLVSECEFRTTRKRFRLATDTGGEISFLEDFCKLMGHETKETLQISLLPHLRTRILAESRSLGNVVISASACLQFFRNFSIEEYMGRKENRKRLGNILKQFESNTSITNNLDKIFGETGKGLELLTRLVSLISSPLKRLIAAG